MAIRYFIVLLLVGCWKVGQTLTGLPSVVVIVLSRLKLLWL
jgi:hypothetical protein